MTNKRSSTGLGGSKDNVQLETLVEQLKSKLNNFVVLDGQGEVIGEVKDLSLDTTRQLNLVVSQLNPEPRARLFLLNSKLIQKVDAANKSVLVDINKAEVERLPEYITTATKSSEISESSNKPVNIAIDATDSDRVENSLDSKPTDIPVLVQSKNIQEEPDQDSTLQSSDPPDVLAGEIIRLLGERVVVNRNKRKVGEVIVRKEIETRMVQVQVPVRHEKLIIEQVSPEHKQLAEIDLTSGEVSGIELSENASQELEIDRLDKLTDSNT